MLWDDLSFLVIEGEFDLSLLPVEFKPLGSRPRRFALAETLHNNEFSSELFAVFKVGDFSVLAPPSRVWSRTGITTWQEALAQNGAVWSFSTSSGLYAICKHELVEGVVEFAQVDDFRARGEVLGRTEPLTSVDDVFVTMGELLAGTSAVGIASLQMVLRTGEALFYEVSSS